MHLQQTKRGSRKTGGLQYYFHKLSEPVKLFLRKKGAVRVALVTPYGATKSDFFAVGTHHTYCHRQCRLGPPLFKIRRPFDDSTFKAFVLSDDLLPRAVALLTSSTTSDTAQHVPIPSQHMRLRYCQRLFKPCWIGSVHSERGSLCSQLQAGRIFIPMPQVITRIAHVGIATWQT